MTALDTANDAGSGATPPAPRPEISEIPLYSAGKQVAPRPGLTSQKLSSNENPFTPIPEVIRAISAATELNRYPDPTATPLREALAAALDVPLDRVGASAGSLDLLNRLLLAFAGRRPDGTQDEVVYAWRSFEAYPLSVRVSGARSVQIPLREDGTHDLPSFLRAITGRTRVIILCTPNNPTGPALTHSAVAGFLQRVPPHILVVLDEAYTEFVRMDDPLRSLDLTRRHANLLVLRTFSKAHGLADLRVGYCVAHPEVLAALQRTAVPFPVSKPAQAAAAASLAHLPAVLDRVDILVEERDRLARELRDRGWRFPDPQGNFLWLPLGERAETFHTAAAELALSLRTFPGDGVRITVGTREANDRILDLCSAFEPLATLGS